MKNMQKHKILESTDKDVLNGMERQEMPYNLIVHIMTT